MKEIIEIFNQLVSTSGRNDKELILKKNKDNKLFKEILNFVYNPYILTGLSDKKINKNYSTPAKVTTPLETEVNNETN